MLLSRSTGRKVTATAITAVGFAFLYEVTVLDSRYAARQAELREETAAPAPGARLRFTATAYCKGTTTASGVNVRKGIAAADPDLLPVGSVIQIERLPDQYNGVYTIMDTGPKVHGRQIDIYMWNCNEALAFGRRSIAINVLRLGWNPKASAPASIAANIIAKPDAAAPGYPAGYGPGASAAGATPAATPVAVTAPPPPVSPAALEDAPK
jgi:3D (Asp-Asp-Asp) domain-containing protein